MHMYTKGNVNIHTSHTCTCTVIQVHTSTCIYKYMYTTSTCHTCTCTYKYMTYKNMGYSRVKRYPSAYIGKVATKTKCWFHVPLIHSYHYDRWNLLWALFVPTNASSKSVHINIKLFQLFFLPYNSTKMEWNTIRTLDPQTINRIPICHF